MLRISPAADDLPQGVRSVLKDKFKFFFGGIAVFAVKQQTENLFEQPQAALVTHGGEVLVSLTVCDGEAPAQERDVFIAGNVLAVGVTHEQVHRLVLDPLMHEEHIAFGFDLDFVRHVLR